MRERLALVARRGHICQSGAIAAAPLFFVTTSTLMFAFGLAASQTFDLPSIQ